MLHQFCCYLICKIFLYISVNFELHTVRVIKLWSTIKIRYNAVRNKDDIKVVTKLPRLLGHAVQN